MTDVPVGDVDVMDVLLDDMVAGHFREADPVADHVVGVAFAGPAILIPQGAAAPPDGPAGDLADGAALDGVLWRADGDGNGTVDPGEVASLLFHQTVGRWVADGAFTPDFAAAFGEPPEEARRADASPPPKSVVKVF